jgi:hypothetical protein
MDNNSTNTITWETPTPITLPSMAQSSAYPIDALPAIIQDPIINYQKYGQQPLALCACSVLANVSLACQTLANVARDDILISPVSLYFLVIANSGERKSAADKAFSKGIRQWQLTTREKLMTEVAASEILHNAWIAERDSLTRQIRKADNAGENTFFLQQELRELLVNEPTVPLLPELFFEDTTQEAFTASLAYGWPSSSLWSDEGGIVLSSHGMHSNSTKFIATLNRLWDGNPFITHRKTSKSFVVSNRRLTISLMLQPLIMQQLLAKGGGAARQSGFLARMLIAQPNSSMGNRYYQNPPESLTSLAQFQQRITECLNATLELDIKGCHELPTLRFSTSAKNKWIAFFNNIEAGITNSKQWLIIQDFASKAAENAARLAALLHLFQGKEGDIKAETVEQAIAIIYWHLQEAKQIVNTDPEYNHETDAQKILNWLKNKGLNSTNYRHIQQYGPVRDKLKRTKALEILIENHYLKEIKQGSTTSVEINPSVFA